MKSLSFITHSSFGSMRSTRPDLALVTMLVSPFHFQPPKYSDYTTAATARGFSPHPSRSHRPICVSVISHSTIVATHHHQHALWLSNHTRTHMLEILNFQQRV